MASASATLDGKEQTATPSPATHDVSSTAPASTASVTAARVGEASTAPSTTVRPPVPGTESASGILWVAGDVSVRQDGGVRVIPLTRIALSPKSLSVATVRTTTKVGAFKHLVFLLSPSILRWAR